MEKINKKNKLFYGWIILPVCWAIYACCIAPAYYGYSVMIGKMMVALDMTTAQANLAFSLSLGVSGIVSPIIGRIVDKFGAKKTIIAGTVGLAVSGFILAFFANDWITYTLTYGILLSISKALCTLVPLQTIVTYWFNEKRATALGIIASAGGVGGLIFTPMLEYSIINFGSWRAGWAFVGIMACFSALLAILFIKNKPSDIGQIPDGEVSNPQKDEAIGDGGKKRKGMYITKLSWKQKDAIKSPVFWAIVFSGCATMMSSTAVIGNIQIYVSSINIETQVAVMSIVSGISIVGRLFGGWICNYFEGKRAFLFGHMFLLSAMIFLIMSQNTYMIYTFAILFGLGYGITYTIPSVLISSYFGSENYGSIFGFFWMTQSFTSMLSPVITGYIKDATGSYMNAWYIITVIVVLACIATFFIKVPTKNTNKNQEE